MSTIHQLYLQAADRRDETLFESHRFVPFVYSRYLPAAAPHCSIPVCCGHLEYALVHIRLLNAHPQREADVGERESLEFRDAHRKVESKRLKYAHLPHVLLIPFEHHSLINLPLELAGCCHCYYSNFIR